MIEMQFEGMRKKLVGNREEIGEEIGEEIKKTEIKNGRTKERRNEREGRCLEE